MKSAHANPHHGSDFEDFLKQEGMFEEVDAVATKRVLAWQLRQSIEKKKISKSELAKRMKTSRAQVDRLLDPNYQSINLLTIERAASALGMRLNIALTEL